MKQLPLIPRPQYRKRKTARIIGTRRAQNHVILKARIPILRRHRAIVLRSIRDTQDRFHIRIRALAVMSDHLHLVIRVTHREQFANAMRMLAGTIARRIMKKGTLWRQRVWSRLVLEGRDLWNVCEYVIQNPHKAAIASFDDTWWILGGVLQV